MFKWLTVQFCSKCFKFGTGPDCEDHDIIKNPYANATTPDELIAAKVVREIAKDFEAVSFTETTEKYNRYNREVTIKVKDIVFTYTKEKNCYGETRACSNYRVNGVSISPEAATLIYTNYFKVKKEQDELQRLAAEAKRKMEENEQKWNLAEQLLGMKRLPNGALVPKDYQEPEQSNKFSPCTSSCCAT